MAVFPDRIVLKNSTDTDAQIRAAIGSGGADEIAVGEVVLGVDTSSVSLYTRAGDDSIVTISGSGGGGGSIQSSSDYGLETGTAVPQAARFNWYFKTSFNVIRNSSDCGLSTFRNELEIALATWTAWNFNDTDATPWWEDNFKIGNPVWVAVSSESNYEEYKITSINRYDGNAFGWDTASFGATRVSDGVSIFDALTGTAANTDIYITTERPITSDIQIVNGDTLVYDAITEKFEPKEFAIKAMPDYVANASGQAAPYYWNWTDRYEAGEVDAGFAEMDYNNWLDGFITFAMRAYNTSNDTLTNIPADWYNTPQIGDSFWVKLDSGVWEEYKLTFKNILPASTFAWDTLQIDGLRRSDGIRAFHGIDDGLSGTGRVELTWNRPPNSNSLPADGEALVYNKAAEAFQPQRLVSEVPEVSVRGDGGDFDTGTVDVGFAMGIYGGGDFTAGTDDKPIELTNGNEGPDAGVF